MNSRLQNSEQNVHRLIESAAKHNNPTSAMQFAQAALNAANALAAITRLPPDPTSPQRRGPTTIA